MLQSRVGEPWMYPLPSGRPQSTFSIHATKAKLSLHSFPPSSLYFTPPSPKTLRTLKLPTSSLNCPHARILTKKVNLLAMAASTPGARHSQAFRDVSTSAIVLIPTRLGKKTEERFVLWKDILAIFNNAHYITHDNEAVLFMVDDNFEQQALRINSVQSLDSVIMLASFEKITSCLAFPC